MVIHLKLDADEPIKGFLIQRVITFGAGKHLMERLTLLLGFTLFVLEVLLRRLHVIVLIVYLRCINRSLKTLWLILLQWEVTLLLRSPFTLISHL